MSDKKIKKCNCKMCSNKCFECAHAEGYISFDDYKCHYYDQWVEAQQDACSHFEYK